MTSAKNDRVADRRKPAAPTPPPRTSTPAPRTAAPTPRASTPAPRTSSSNEPRKRAANPAEARRHFEELLKAKQERVRQGPNYPAPNPYTGRHEGEAPVATNADDDSTQAAADTTPAPEATYGETHTHARGNQGMRNQK